MKITRCALRSLLALFALLLALPPVAMAEVAVEIRLLLIPGDAVVRPSVERQSPQARYAVNSVPVPEHLRYVDLGAASARNAPQDMVIPMPSAPVAVNGQSAEPVSRISLRIEADPVALRGAAHSMPLVIDLDIPSHVGAELSIRCTSPVGKSTGPLLKAQAIPCLIGPEQPHSVFRNAPFDATVMGR
jgi:hypothetical protein